MYQIIDYKTQRVVKTCKTRDSAYRTADRMDAQYGAVRFVVRFI